MHPFEVEESRVQCPYCGEPLNVLLDGSAGNQEYIEDCQVCCRPIVFQLTVDFDGEFSVAVLSEND